MVPRHACRAARVADARIERRGTGYRMQLVAGTCAHVDPVEFEHLSPEGRAALGRVGEADLLK